VAQLSALLTKITNQFPGASAVSTTIQKEFINQAYARLWRLSRNVAEYSSATVAGQLEYILPTDFITVSEVRWDGDPLRPLTVNDAYAYDSDWRTTAGTPTYFNQEGDRLRVFPIDAVGSKVLIITYRGKPADLVADADIPDLPDGYDDVLVDYACWKCAIHLEKPSAQATFKAMWDEGVNRFSREMQGQQVEPEQVADHWWSRW
jgi:hypothetical protein